MAFNHEGRRAHAQNQAVSAAVEGKGRLLNDVVGGCGTGSGKSTGNPLPKVVSGHIISADDDHAVNTTGVQPVFSDTERCGCRGTCEVDGGVWSPNTRVLGKLGMAHVEGLEEVSAVKTTLAIIAVVLGVLRSHLKARETRREDDARPFSLNLRHLPVANQTQSTFADLFNGREGNACVAKGEQTRSDGQLGADVPSNDGFGVDAKFFGQIEGTLESGELRDVAKGGGLIHVHRAVPSFDEADDVLVKQALFVFVRDLADTGLSSNQFLKSVLRKDPIHAGQAQ